MPAANDHARNLSDLCDELRAKSLITRICSRCDWTLEGTFADTAGPMRQHLADAHDVRSRKKQGRSGFVTDTVLENNIARTRAAGSTVNYPDLDIA